MKVIMKIMQSNHTHTHTHMCVRMYMHVYICMCVYTHVDVYVCVQIGMNTKKIAAKFYAGSLSRKVISRFLTLFGNRTNPLGCFPRLLLGKIHQDGVCPGRRQSSSGRGGAHWHCRRPPGCASAPPRRRSPGRTATAWRCGPPAPSPVPGGRFRTLRWTGQEVRRKNQQSGISN